MSWFSDLYRSAVGKKAVMAVTGILLFGFIVLHLIGNLKLLGEVDFSGVDLSGGTGDMPQFAQPTVGLLYDFR